VASDEAAALDAGDILWIDFGAPTGHEQGGRRPAVVLTAWNYNARSSVIVVCPITRRRRNWPFEVALPAAGPLDGVILVDQIKAVDPTARPVGYGGRVPNDILTEVRARLAALLGIPVSN
jgi:mRNA interferase MazF